VGYPNVRIRQMEAKFFYVVQALVHVKVGLGIAPVQIERLECGPWSELRGQVPANIVSGKTEDAPDTSKNMHLHFTICLAARASTWAHGCFHANPNGRPVSTYVFTLLRISGHTLLQPAYILLSF
jgi:hypothetical protein